MTSSCNLVRLGRNLEALCNASTRSQALVSNPVGGEVILANSFRGKIWQAMGRVASSSDTIQAKHKRTLVSIQNQFCLAMTAIAEIDSQYRVKILVSPGVKELGYLNSQVIRIGKQLNVLFSPISSIPVKERLNMINVAYQASNGVSFFTAEQERVVHRMSLDHAFCLVSLRIGRPYPFAVFSKILQREQLNQNDEMILGEWIEKLQRPSSYVTVGLLHAALRCCVEILEKDLSPQSDAFLDKLSLLEWCIIKGKAALLEEYDPDHMMWVRSLIPEGAALHVGNEQITVDKQVKIESENLTFFQVKNCPERLIVCGKNNAHVGVWRYICTNFSWSIEPVSCLFQDPNGRFCVIEKIDTSLAEITWKSSDTGIDNEDTAILNELATLLEYWAMHTYVPKDISDKDIFIRKRGDDVVLKVVKSILCTETEFTDYNRLEEFCRLFAKGNITVYTYLMNQSRLVEHPVALAYAKAALNMLSRQKSATIETDLGLYGISDRRVLLQARKYVQDLKIAQDMLFSRLCFRLNNSELEESFVGVIAQKLVEVHKESGFFSVVHPHLTSKKMMKKLEDDILKRYK